MKQCTKCREWKKLGEFWKDKYQKDGYYPRCKVCKKEHAKYYNRKNKEKIKEQKKDYNNSNAKYETYKDKLTVDESPKLHEDGISLEVKCRYCGKYFIPNNIQVKNRTQSLNGQTEGDCGLYCSDGCKSECPIFKKQLYPDGFKKATSREVQPQLRQLVLKRDDYTCQKCGSEDTLHCHHIYPLNESPITSADMDECITLCKSCHKLAHKIPGCNYHELRCS